MYRLTDYAWMLRDRGRIDAYTRALAAVITPTTVVLDLGSGLGTFSIIACKLGAKRVYAVEPADIITVAEENARRNGVAERVQFLQARADQIELPEKVDVIVSDLAGALPLFEEHLPSVMHARDRFLAPGGTLIPQRDRLFAAPVSSAELDARIRQPWHVEGIDLTAAETQALNAPHALPVTPEHLVAEPRCWAELDYATITSPNVSATIEWTIPGVMPSAVEASPAAGDPSTSLGMTRPIHGIALWFESTLHGGIVTRSGPWSPDSIHSTMVLPLMQPFAARENETLRMKIDARLASGRYVVTWQVGSAPLAERAPFRLADDVLFRKVGPEIVLLDMTSGTYHVLNETGARVWELLERGQDLESITAAVVSDYDVDPTRAEADVGAIVASLKEAKLIL